METETKKEKYNRDKAFAIEEVIDALEENEFAQIQQEANELKEDVEIYKIREELYKNLLRRIEILGPTPEPEPETSAPSKPDQKLNLPAVLSYFPW